MRSQANPASGAVTPALFVDDVGRFDQMMEVLQSASVLAIDTESDSLFRYTPRVCLIQISMPVSEDEHLESEPTQSVLPTRDYLVDPLALDDISDLGILCADPNIEIILHAAENDILIMQRDFHFSFRNLFDTQLAARILGRKGVGLAAMLADEFGIKSDKRMQRTNWGQRPLTPDQKLYAQLDTCYLPTLRRRQVERLHSAERWEEAQDAFGLLEQIQYSPSNGASSIWDYKRTREVDLKDVGLLESIWRWRDIRAQQLERPPFKVLGDGVLVELTRRKPQRMQELREIRGLSERQIKRFGAELLDVVDQGRQRPTPPLPPAPTEDPLTPFQRSQFDRLRRWRSARARDRGVDPDIVFSNDLLQQIVLLAPTSLADLQSIDSIGSWKSATYGPEILDLLAER